MNRIRWIAFCISGVAILTFTQFPYAATLPTRVEHVAGEMNYNATIESKSDSGIADATNNGAK
jgi:hypothetical protein